MDERTYARYMSDVAYFLSKLEAEPNSYYFIPIALSYNKLEKYDETISICRAGIERFPSHCQAKVLLAEAYIYKGEKDKARDILFDVLTEDEDNYKALKLLGIIYQALEMPDEAIRYFRGAYMRSPEDTDLKRIIEDMGESVDIDEVLKNSATSVAASEEDEDAKMAFEIEQKIKNAELVMADLMADKSIMGPKRGNEKDEKPSPAATATADKTDSNNENSNLLSDEEIEKLLAQANAPVTVPEKQEEPAFDGSSIDEDMARLMSEVKNNSENSENSENGLETALGGEITEEDSSLEDDLSAALNSETPQTEDENDLIFALSEESKEETAAENDLIAALGASDSADEENNNDDLLSALSGGDVSSELMEELTGADDIPEEALTFEGDLPDFTEETAQEEDETHKADDDIPAEFPDDFNGLDTLSAENVNPPENTEPNVDLGDSSPFVQSNIWEEILDASGIKNDDNADEDKDIRERQLKRLEKRLEKLHKRTGK